MHNVYFRRRDNRRHSHRRIPIVGIPSLFFKWTFERPHQLIHHSWVCSTTEQDVREREQSVTCLYRLSCSAVGCEDARIPAVNEPGKSQRASGPRRLDRFVRRPFFAVNDPNSSLRSLDEHACSPNIALKTIPGLLGVDAGNSSSLVDLGVAHFSKSVIASTLILDLERFTTESLTIAKAISTNRAQTRTILLTLERLRSILSALVTPGLSHDIDSICSAKLGLSLPQVSIGSVR